jgi:hypothetical protein
MTQLHHISDGDFARYHFDVMRGLELAMVEEHLLWCLYCLGREAEELGPSSAEKLTPSGPRTVERYEPENQIQRIRT